MVESTDRRRRSLRFGRQARDPRLDPREIVCVPFQAGNLLTASGVDIVRYLFVVSKSRPDLADYLMRHFSDEEDVLVTIDRRRGERRRGRDDTDPERRRGHRRWRPENDEALASVGAFMVPVDAPEPVA